MGHAASCCYISIFPTSTASSHHEEIVEESNLKTHCSRDGVQKKQENQPHQLRLKLLHEIPFVIHHFTIIIIYAPPEFRIHDISFFVAKKVNLPLIDSNSFSSAESPNEESDQTIFETLIHSPDSQKGFVVMNYPNNPKQLRNLQTVFPESRIIPIFIDLDSEV